MKRGLKVIIENVLDTSERCYNRYPDEKGTESKQLMPFAGAKTVGYNRYPDEKGTERHPESHADSRGTGYNRYPDEKGTERLIICICDDQRKDVTTVTPMKRGLKASEGIVIVTVGALQPLPR